jgi:O-antigen/teichoic acid export membrane protein
VSAPQPGLRSVAQRSAVYILARVVPSVVMLGGIAVLTRTLSPQDYGIYALCMSLSVFLYMAAANWLSSTAVRLHSVYYRTHNLIGSVVLVFAGLLPPLALACVAGMGVVGLADEPVMLLFIPLTALFAWTEIFSNTAIARMDARTYGIVQVLRTVLATALGGTLAWLGYGAVGAVAGTTLGYALVGVWTAGLALLEMRRGRGRPWAVREILGFGLPLGLGYAIAGALSYSDRIILAWFADPAAVGLYVLALDLADKTAKSLVTPIGQASVPSINEALAEQGPGHGRELADRRLAQMLVAVMAIGLPATVGLALIAPALANVVVGPQFRSVLAELLPIAAAVTLIGVIKANYLDLAFHLARSTWNFTAATSVHVAIHITIALLLIPSFGLWGGIATLLLSQIVGATIIGWVGRRVFMLPLPARQLAKVAGATAAMAAMVLLVQHVEPPDFSPFLRLAAEMTTGVLAYGAAVVCLDVASLRTFVFRRLRAA